MDIDTLYALRSSSGLPSHPAVFLVLLVLTWALHMIAVHVMLGSTALALTGAFSSNANWRRLTGPMLDTAKVAVSLAIVIGVAPLLFVQVIYDPFWYVSNVLSARWAIAFIVILLTAYWAMYHHYFVGKEGGSATSRWSLAVSLALLLVAGFIMHALTSQALRPELWMAWYAPEGHLETAGSGIHEFNLGRYLFFIVLAAPVTGAWLLGCRRYLDRREPRDAPYLDWIAALGNRLLTAGGFAALICYAAWMAALPESAAGFPVSFWSIAANASILLLIVIPALFRSASGGYGPFVTAAGVILVLATVREALRHRILFGTHGYELSTYAVNLDWYSNALFCLTFAGVGGFAIAYSVAIAWEAGKTPGIYTASPRVNRLGGFALAALIVWVAQYFFFGFLVITR
ncbi:putative membrane protein [Methylococcus capsulatus str. Bath]|uniref:Putative membrane protein n=1 Tax=Methylococcus capsulatus (strain ATCC 33009 / NCIMB 11132 / Bath) TaxID=243233 RepID=Q609P6_METCA|nr:hypothetical protein [Methylococcus capsulatus]AAU92753.1 putative membrane protein [Methylococcus capsulatus str. Bath]